MNISNTKLLMITVLIAGICIGIEIAMLVVEKLRNRKNNESDTEHTTLG